MTDAESATASMVGASPAPDARPRHWRVTILWIVGTVAVHALLASWAPLLPDEAYYWTWTKHPAAGYFDHPPGVAIMIAFGTALFGDTILGVRAGAAIASLTTHLCLVFAAWQLAGRDAHGGTAARRAAMLFALAPMALFGLVMATPDAPFFACASVALLAVERALAAPLRTRRGFAWWTLVGVAAGASVASKYIAVLLPAALLVACVVHPALRVRFRDAGAWWASFLALTIFSPVVWWNARNNWISFRFQINHGFTTAAPASPLTNELELLGGQLGLATPILFCLMSVAVWAALREGWATRGAVSPTAENVRRFAFAVMAIVPGVFFAISAWRRPAEPNWPALMYPTAIVLLATSRASVARGGWWRGGTALAAAVLVLLVAQVWRPTLPIPARRDPVAQAHGWRDLANAAERATRDAFLANTRTRWVAANRYQETSQLAFHLSGHPTVFSLNVGGRANQFDLWPTAGDIMEPEDGMVAIFNDNPAGDSLGASVARWFQASRRGEQVVLRRNAGAWAHRRVWLYRFPIHVPASPSREGLRAGRVGIGRVLTHTLSP